MINHNASKELLLRTSNEYVTTYVAERNNLTVATWLPTILFKTLIEYINYHKAKQDCIFHGAYKTYIYFYELSVFSERAASGHIDDEEETKGFIHLKDIIKNGFLFKSKLYYYD